MMVYMAKCYWLFCNFKFIITDVTKTNLINTNVSFLHLKKYIYFIRLDNFT